MAEKTGIEWTDASWNPVVGCSIVSPGCTNCYAMGQAARIIRCAAGSGRDTHYAGTVREVKGKPVWTGKLALAPEHILLQPLRWKRGRRIFVNSMGDLFHEDVPDEWIDRVFAVMALAPQHTYQVLTKRAARMRAYIAGFECDGARRFQIANAGKKMADSAGRDGDVVSDKVLDGPWPLPNVWLGVSAEDQARADERVPELLATPTAVRFVSAEPLLGPIDFNDINWPQNRPRFPATDDISDGRSALRMIEGSRIDWIIVGGESGPGARPMHPDWARAIRDQCAAAGTAFFFKQWGEWLPGEANRGQFDERPMHAYRRCDDHSYDWPRMARIPASAIHNFGTHKDPWSGDLISRRVGKNAAGRLLDGVEHNAMPEVRS